MIALAALLATSPVWRSYEEVFDLALDRNSVLAATNGGLLRDGVAVPSPAGLRSIESVDPLIVSLSDGSFRRREGGRWVASGQVQRGRSLASGIELDPGAKAPWSVAPPAHPYAALRVRTTLYAGTNDGLFRLDAGAWTRCVLPTRLPLPRPNGIAQVGDQFVVGGLGGLYIGRPGNWKRVCEDSIRQVAAVGDEVWVVHGNGAVDKLNPKADQLFPDILVGNSRRAWTSCIGRNGDTLLFGGLGGWAERSGSEQFPDDLKNDVVTAIAGREDIRWVGAQKSGLFRFQGGKVFRWNPGNGLPDTWVTSLLRTPAGLLVGTLHRGLFLLAGDGIKPVPSPTERVTSLGVWKGHTVVGGMDGAWISKGAVWSPLNTGGEETTSIAPLKGRLAITTATGVHFVSP